MVYTSSFLFDRDFLLKENPQNSFQIVQLLRISLDITNGFIANERRYNLFPSVGLALLTGQQPKTIRAKKSVASFKLKVGSVVGCQVIIRGKRMKTFLDTLTLLVFPQLKQEKFFSSHALDNPGTLCFGLNELSIFPELEGNFEVFGSLEGCFVQLHTDARTRFEKTLLLSFHNLPVYSHDKRKHSYEKRGL